MELLIKGKNVEIEKTAQDYIKSKISRLERHLPDIEEVKVELSQETTKSSDNRYVAQITINSRGTLLRGEEKGSSLYAAIDTVVDVLNRQIERFKDKLYRSKRRVLPFRRELAAEQIQEELEKERGEEGESKIVRVKRFPVKPMTPEEAVDQMELLSHDFFIFFNPESNRFSVLYRRGDGNYGLIEPELA
jgi:putative sigma-54 modulation protein